MKYFEGSGGFCVNKIYKGSWLNDLRSGYGEINFKVGSLDDNYNGEVVEVLKIFEMPSLFGSYKGNFLNGSYNG